MQSGNRGLGRAGCPCPHWLWLRWNRPVWSQGRQARALPGAPGKPQVCVSGPACTGAGHSPGHRDCVFIYCPGEKFLACPATLWAVSRFRGCLSSEVEMKAACRGQVTAQHARLLPRAWRWVGPARRTRAGSLWLLLTAVRRLGPPGRARGRDGPVCTGQFGQGGRVRAPSLLRGEPAPSFLLRLWRPPSGRVGAGRPAEGPPAHPPRQRTTHAWAGAGPGRKERKEGQRSSVGVLPPAAPPLNQTGLGASLHQRRPSHTGHLLVCGAVCVRNVYSPETFQRWAFSLAPPHS